VFALAKLEPEGGIYQVGGLPGDRITEVRIQAGATVKEGDVLIRLASYDSAEAELKLLTAQQKRAAEMKVMVRASATAQDAEAQEKIAQAQRAARFDLTTGDKKISHLEEQLAKSEDMLARVSTSGLPRLEVQKQEIQVSELRSELGLARLTRERAVSATSEATQLANLQRVSAEKNLERLLSEIPMPLNESIELATRRRNMGEILAPVSGKVLTVSARKGELVGQMPLLQIADTSRMIAVAEVYETNKADLEKWMADKGIQLTIASPVIGSISGEKSLTGKVVRISSVIGRNQYTPLDPVQDADRRIFEVRILLDQPELASRLINHEATVEFKPVP